jgi:putative oxidoreductase
MKKILSTKYNESAWSLGLLILRIAFGGVMLIHGLDKIKDFDSVRNMGVFGAPTDGILIIFAELFCAIFLVLGLFTRFAVIPLIIAMSVAFFKAHKGILIGEHNGQAAFLYLCAYICILLTGPGKYSVDRMIAK